MAPMVMNCLDRENTVVIGGASFTFKPRQIKLMYNQDVANVITRVKAEMGFVGLSDDFEDKDYQNSPEGKKIIEEKLSEGVNNYVRKLREWMHNEQVSLAKDLGRANEKTDPKVYMADGKAAQHMREILKYQSQKDDAAQKKIDEIKELEKQMSQIKG